MITSKFIIWFCLTILLGSLIIKFHLKHVSTKSKSNKIKNNKLGKAMVNMERASIFGDYINFYEFTKYAIREAMKLPQGETGLKMTLNDILIHLNRKNVDEDLINVINEVYEMSEFIENKEEQDIDTTNLSEKLKIYYDVIRKLNIIFN